jgi:SAM-dependent methyltransferase
MKTQQAASSTTAAGPEFPPAEEFMSAQESVALLQVLRARETYRDEYWLRRDPINAERLRWRANTLRHTAHLVPGHSILELGCGHGFFSRALAELTRGENPITCVTFQSSAESRHPGAPLVIRELPGLLSGRRFDCVVAMDLLDDRTSSQLLRLVSSLLKPGGTALFYESNPWNPVYRIRCVIARAIGRPDQRSLVNRRRLYELCSEIGFIRVYAVYNDFVFSPLTRPLIWFLRNLSILLENTPVVCRLAGSILLHAQKPRVTAPPPGVSLCTIPALRQAVSVVIPCHNEEMNIRPLLEGIISHYGDYLNEIVLVNDCSTDDTGRVLDQEAARNQRLTIVHRRPPGGVGRAITDGLRAASGKYVLTMDCDFVHLLPELRDMFEASQQGCDVVIGSRFSRLSVLLNYPFQKIVANRMFHVLARVLLRRRFGDVTNNLKLFRREVVQNLLLLQPGFAVNAETGLQPLVLGYRVREVPISWVDRRPGMGISSFRLMRVGGGYWRVLLNLWLNKVCRRGPYRNLVRILPEAPHDAAT